MKKPYFLLIACVLMLTIASIPEALCYPPAGLDTMPSTTATIEVEIIDMFNETLVVKGPTTVNRSNPYDPGDGRIKIDTEIVSMQLTGSSSYIGPITIIESPSKNSTGAIQQQTPGIDFPADSFFDVFIEIQTMAGTFHNDDPKRMNATIDQIPPYNSTYEGPQTIPLKNATDYTIGFIKWTNHTVEPTHDVAVTDVKTYSTKHGPPGSPYTPVTECYMTWTISINVTVKNNGTETETFTVFAYAGNATGNYTIGTAPVTLASGASTTKTFTWDVPDLAKVICTPYWNYTIYGNATLPGDTNPNNDVKIGNVVKVKGYGDGNGDGKIGLIDLMILAPPYRVQIPGPPPYDPQADFSGDGPIGLTDLMVLAMNYRKGPCE